MARKATTVKKTQAKKTKAKKTKASWKQCSAPKCRRRAKKDSDLCAKCYEATFPVESVQQLTVVEALRFSSMDAEIRNHGQGIQILKLESTQDQTNYAARQKARETRIQQLVAEANAKKAEYTAFINELATKYDMDPKMMAIDSESRVIRDLRTEANKE